LATDSVTQGVKDLSADGVNNADFLAVKPSTGEVLAWVGSADYYNDQIGGQVNVVLSKRQPGSSFKPYVYEAAFKDHKLAPGSTVDDTPQTFEGNYQPKDFDGKFMGKMTARKALVLSRNVPAVETGVKEGMANVDNLAHAMGITTKLDTGPNTAIGGSDVTLYDHVQGFATFANQGTKLPLMSILKITDSHGNLLSETKPGAQDGKQQVTDASRGLPGHRHPEGLPEPVAPWLEQADGLQDRHHRRDQQPDPGRLDPRLQRQHRRRFLGRQHRGERGRRQHQRLRGAGRRHDHAVLRQRPSGGVQRLHQAPGRDCRRQGLRRNPRRLPHRHRPHELQRARAVALADGVVIADTDSDRAGALPHQRAVDPPLAAGPIADGRTIADRSGHAVGRDLD